MSGSVEHESLTPVSTSYGRCSWSRVSPTVRRLLLAVVLLIDGSVSASAQQSPIRLYTILPLPSAQTLAQAVMPQEIPHKPWIRSRRRVTLTAQALEQLGPREIETPAEFALDLPSIGTVTASVRSRPRTGRRGLAKQVWAGTLKRHTDSDVVLVANGALVAGSIRHGRTLFEIRPGAAGSHDLIEVDADALPSDHHPIPVSREDVISAEAAVEPPGQNTAPSTSSDDGSVIDVMVVYTTAAKNANGGQDGIEALIDLGIALANTAFSNSQITTQFQLVHAAEVNYTESGSYNTDLGRLRSANDGFMDEVHAWRNTYNADLVALIEDNLGGACGVAYVMTTVGSGFAPWAFSVTQDSCISGYTLAHELGHNMGSQHDRLEGGTGAYPYSFGHKEAGKFRTIMAYPCTPNCTRINHFSNPNVRYQGNWTTGVDHNIDPANSADNARAFSNALGTIATFRDSGGPIDTTPPPAPANLRVVDP